jgi:hypothetical protein
MIYIYKYISSLYEPYYLRWLPKLVRRLLALVKTYKGLDELDPYVKHLI